MTETFVVSVFGVGGMVPVLVTYAILKVKEGKRNA